MFTFSRTFDRVTKISMLKTYETRVLFIVPSLKMAGAETQVVNLVNSIATPRISKYVFTFLPDLDQLDRLDLQSSVFYHEARRNKFDLSIIGTIAKIIKKNRIHIVHCTIQYSLFLAYLARLLSSQKPKLVCAIHTTLNKSQKGELFDRHLYVPLLRQCARIIFVCRNQAHHWETKYPFLSGRYTVIHNGVDVSYFDPRAFDASRTEFRRRLSIPPEASVVSCIAGFRSEKGHDILIEAFSHLDHHVYMLLAGDGPTRNVIAKQVSRKGLQQRVRFLGQVQDVRPVLAASDVSVLSSTSVETFSIAMLESMSMEVPVVATDIGGLSEAIFPGITGELVPPRDPKALGLALSKVLHNVRNSHSMRRNCREKVKTTFSLNKMASTTERLLIGLSQQVPVQERGEQS